MPYPDFSFVVAKERLTDTETGARVKKGTLGIVTSSYLDEDEMVCWVLFEDEAKTVAVPESELDPGVDQVPWVAELQRSSYQAGRRQLHSNVFWAVVLTGVIALVLWGWWLSATGRA